MWAFLRSLSCPGTIYEGLKVHIRQLHDYLGMELEYNEKRLLKV